MNRPTTRFAGVATALAAAGMLTVGHDALASARPVDSDDVLPQRFTADSGGCRLGVTSGTISFVFPALHTVEVEGEVFDRKGSPSPGPCQEDGRKTVARFTGLSRGERVDTFAIEVDNGRMAFADKLSSVNQTSPRPIDTVGIVVCRFPALGLPPTPTICGEPVFIRALALK